MQDLVDNFSTSNQIRINTSPTGSAIDGFYPPVVNADITTTGKLQIEGSGTHYVMGNLGVGTNTPQEKLSVNGKIRAKEIKVEVTNWPDYVFKPDYPKMSLDDIEKYIKVNGRLPEIPSASKVEKEGIELGEMNKLLLKKIEEMTLQLIELKKRIDIQEEQLEKKVAN